MQLKIFAKMKPQTYITSDLHLDHKNIIKYCKRPFKSVNQMNRILIRNWNRKIRKYDTVYFLGDLAFGRDSKNTDYWIRKLNGKIIFIKGNHDRSREIKFHNQKIIKVHGMRFLLIHSSYDKPENWDEWVICGHHHNNTPFIDPKRKVVNVSVENTNYYPVHLNYVVKKVRAVENKRPFKGVKKRGFISRIKLWFGLEK